jgi:hypothetical protein
MPDVLVTTSLTHKKYTRQSLPFAVTASITQEGEIASKTTQIATTSWAAVTNAVETMGVLAIRNMDYTNYVEVALDDDNTDVFAKLLPRGLPLVLPVLTSATYYIKANTASCSCSVMETQA